jgi:hypothetical protein
MHGAVAADPARSDAFNTVQIVLELWELPRGGQLLLPLRGLPVDSRKTGCPQANGVAHRAWTAASQLPTVPTAPADSWIKSSGSEPQPAAALARRWRAAIGTGPAPGRRRHPLDPPRSGPSHREDGRPCEHCTPAAVLPPRRRTRWHPPFPLSATRAGRPAIARARRSGPAPRWASRRFRLDEGNSDFGDLS